METKKVIINGQEVEVKVIPPGKRSGFVPSTDPRKRIRLAFARAGLLPTVDRLDKLKNKKRKVRTSDF